MIEPVINPESARMDNFTSITAEESMMRRFKGTIGKDINWKEYEGRTLPPL